MKILRNIILIALALLIQSSFFGRLDILGVRPDLAMLVLLFIAFSSHPVESILYGFMIGFLQDVYSPEYLGYNSLTMAIMGFLLGVVSERVTVEKSAVLSLVAFFSCLVHDYVYMLLYTGFDHSVIGRLFLISSLPGAVYTSLLSLIIIILWDWAEKGGLLVVIRQLMGIRSRGNPPL